MSTTPQSQRPSQKNPRDSMDTLPTGQPEGFEAVSGASSQRGSTEDPVHGKGGEGNVEADRRYREGVKKTVASGEVEELAEEAARALDGEEAADLRAAEERGRKGQHR